MRAFPENSVEVFAGTLQSFLGRSVLFAAACVGGSMAGLFWSGASVPSLGQVMFPFVIAPWAFFFMPGYFFANLFTLALYVATVRSESDRGPMAFMGAAAIIWFLRAITLMAVITDSIEAASQG